MPTLIVSSWLSNGSHDIAAAARQMKWQVICLDEQPLGTLAPHGDYVYYGATNIACSVAEKLNLALLEPPFDLLAKLPTKFTRRTIHYATVATARRLTAPAFVKPADALNKCFDSGVYPSGWAIPERRGFPETTPVLIGEPVTWEVEYRCFLLEGLVTTCSPYTRSGRWIRAGDHRWIIPLQEREQLLAFCRELYADGNVRLPPAVTLDVGYIENRGWAVVELNPAWCSGLYNCDGTGVLSVLRRACMPYTDLKTNDKNWVVSR